MTESSIWACKAVGMHDGKEYGYAVAFTSEEIAAGHERVAYLEACVVAAFRGRYRTDPMEVYWELQGD